MGVTYYRPNGKALPTPSELRRILRDRGFTGEEYEQQKKLYFDDVREAKAAKRTSPPEAEAKEGIADRALSPLLDFAKEHRTTTEVGSTAAVGAGTRALLAPLLATGPAGVAANLAVPPIAVGATQYGLSRGYGEPRMDAAKDALMAGGAEALAGPLAKLVGRGARGGHNLMRRLLNRGVNPSLDDVARAVAGVTDDVGRAASGSEVTRGFLSKMAKAESRVTSFYDEFERLGGAAMPNLTDAENVARTQLRNPGLSKTAYGVYEDFLGRLDEIDRGIREPFTLKSLDDYAKGLKRAIRGQQDGNVRHAIGELLTTVEGSIDDAARSATGNGEALRALRAGRALHKRNLTLFKDSKLAAAIEGGEESTVRYFQNASPQQISEMRKVLPRETFDVARSSFMTDRVIGKLDVDDLGHRGIGTLHSRLFKDRRLREQFDAYFGREGRELLEAVSRAHGAEDSLAPFIRAVNGSLFVPIAAASGVGFHVGGSVGAAAGTGTVVAGALLYSQMLASPTGRKVLRGMFKVARSGNEVAVRAAVQRARKFAESQGWEPDISIQQIDLRQLQLEGDQP